jgi:hypothetical protein
VAYLIGMEKLIDENIKCEDSIMLEKTKTVEVKLKAYQLCKEKLTDAQRAEIMADIFPHTGLF